MTRLRPSEAGSPLARARLETHVALFENGDGPYSPFVERARAKLADLP
jgi:hypothetical protein